MMCAKFILVVLFILLSLILAQEGNEEQFDAQIDIDPSMLVKRSSLLAGVAASPNTTPTATSEDGGVITFLLQILGGIVQGMLNSQGITDQHVDNALNVFSPQKVHDDLLLFRKVLNLGLRFITFVMTFFPRPSANGGYNPLSFFSNKIAFYNTQPVSENGQFLKFTPIEPVSETRPDDIPDRIKKVVDFATQEAAAEKAMMNNGSDSSAVQNQMLGEDEVKLFTNNSTNSSDDRVQTTTVINITQFVNDSLGGNLKGFNTRYVENDVNGGGGGNNETYPSAWSTAQPLPLLRLLNQHAILPEESNGGLFDADNDIGSDFVKLHRNRIVKKATPDYTKEASRVRRR